MKNSKSIFHSPHAFLPLLGALAVALVIITVQMQNFSPANVNPPVSGGSRSSKNNVPTIPPPSEEEEEPGGEETPPGEGQGGEVTPPEEGGHGEGGHEGMGEGEGEGAGEHAAAPAPAPAPLPAPRDYVGCPDVTNPPPYAPTMHEAYMTDFEFGVVKENTSNGNWNDASIWSDGRVPTETERVRVKAGTVVTVPNGDHYVRSVIVKGRLTFATAASTRTRFFVTGGCGGIIVKTGGAFVIGTPADPALGQVNVVFRDVPIDTTVDPGQFGNGLVAVGGRVQTHGRPVSSTYVRQTDDVRAGAMYVDVETPMTDWQRGDYLLLVDTRQQRFEQRREFDWQVEYPIIDRVVGRRIYFQRPTEFAHNCARLERVVSLAPVEKLCPSVAKMYSNVTFESENPDGTRGHTLFTDRTEVDVRYTAFNSLGRTTVSPPDSARFGEGGVVERVGTNQLGRYAFHLHHLVGPRDSEAAGMGEHQVIAIGNFYFNGLKWLVTVHNTHYGLFEDLVMFLGGGSGFQTEVGNESYNIIRRVFAAGFVYGGGTGSEFPLVGFPGGFWSGFTGDGMWLHGNNNTVVDVDLTNNRLAGLHLWNYGHDGSLLFPTRRGVAYSDDPGSFIVDGRWRCDDCRYANIHSYVNNHYGILGWSMLDLLYSDLVTWYNAGPDFRTIYGNRGTFSNWKSAADPVASAEYGTSYTVGFAEFTYPADITIRGCAFSGYRSAMEGGAFMFLGSQANISIHDCETQGNSLLFLDDGRRGILDLVRTNIEPVYVTP